jgi:hypothetical protein
LTPPPPCSAWGAGVVHQGLGELAERARFSYRVLYRAAVAPGLEFVLSHHLEDTGFDPLIQHLKGRKILAARWRDVSEIPLLKVPNGKSPGEKMAAIVAHLQLRGSARPRKVKTLSNTINALFQTPLPEEELVALINELQAPGPDLHHRHQRQL